MQCKYRMGLMPVRGTQWGMRYYMPREQGSGGEVAMGIMGGVVVMGKMV